MVNKLCVSDRVYTLLRKRFLLFDMALLKTFVCSRVGILDYPWCNNPFRTYQELGQGDFYSFDQKFIYCLPTKNVTARKTMLTSISSTTFVRVDIYRLVKLDFLVLLLFLVNYPPSMTTLRFPHSSMNIMADVENILNDDEFFGDTVDTPNEGIEQHRKRECLKSVISKGKAYLLGSKWTQEKEDKASDETINKTYGEYKQCELNEKGEKTGKALGKHVINLYSTRIS